MKNLMFTLLVAISLLSSCAPNKPIDDPEKVKQVIYNYFDGISTKNFQKMKDACTADFVLYEDGKVFNNDSLFNLINAMPKYTAKYDFKNFRVNVDQATASMSYFSHMDLTLNDTTNITFDWLESATFKKEEDVWKLEFMHSTIRK